MVSTLLQKSKLAAAIVRARVVRIDPPFWHTPNHQRPAAIRPEDVATPAHLVVTKVYKGPTVREIEAGIQGACFTPAHCTGFMTEYSWEDVVGYDLILFLNAPYPGDPLQVQQQIYWPFETFVVHPNGQGDAPGARTVDGTGFRSLVRTSCAGLQQHCSKAAE